MGSARKVVHTRIIRWEGIGAQGIYSRRSVFPAAGLYYLAELVEEYSVLGKKILQIIVVVCMLR